MEFYHLNADKERLGEVITGGCFGCLGRTDSYTPNARHWRTVKEFNDKAGLGTHSLGSHEMSDYGHFKEPVHFIELPRAFQHEAYSNLFHSLTARDIVTYLVERSPYSVCFASTVKEIFLEERVLLHAQGVPSEFIISCAFILRELNTSQNPALTFSRLASSAPDVPEFIRLYLSLTRPNLHLGSPNRASCFGEYNSDGVIFPKLMSPELLLKPKYLDPESELLCPLSYNEVQGYTMNVASFWRLSSEPVDMTVLFLKLEKKHHKTHKIQGVFGEIRYQGVHNIGEYAQDFYSELQKVIK